MLKVMADLASQGFLVLSPMSEHRCFDIAAYRDGQFWRIQVKYRAAKNGVVEVGLISSWADKNGLHKSPVKRSEVDVVAIYCPDTNGCYYVTEFGDSISLRLTPTKNGQKKGVLLAEEHQALVSPRTSNPMKG